jgi:hypothetical protein
LNKGVYALGLAAGILIAIYGWFYDCANLLAPALPPSCYHSLDEEWTVVFGIVTVIVSAIGLTRAFLKPKTTPSGTP